MRMKNHFPVKGQALNFVLIQRPGKIGNSLFRSRFFQYHNACFCPSNFAYELFSISLEAIVSPKRNWKQCLCTILEGNKEYYGILKQAYSRAKWGGGGSRRNVWRCFKIAHRYSVHKLNSFHCLFVGYPQVRQTDNNNFIQLNIMG